MPQGSLLLLNGFVSGEDSLLVEKCLSGEGVGHHLGGEESDGGHGKGDNKLHVVILWIRVWFCDVWDQVKMIEKRNK